jgi:hypothetical protein
MADIDPASACLQRANNLVRDAKNKAYSGWKFGPAANAYFAGETAQRILAAAGGGTAVTAVAHAAAGALLAAGLVGASAATFGVAPAVGMALTYLLLKGVAEAKYQSKSNKLKGGGVVQINDEDGSYYAIDDPSNLGPLISKVLKKFERVKRAAAQAGALGTGSHVKSSLRHMKTALKGAAKDSSFLRRHGLVTTEAELFPGLGFNDHELSDRLYELRFYGQMLFNYVEKIVDEIAVPKRNEVADCCHFVYAHVVRQVHFTGNHHNCSKCYAPPPDELDAKLLALNADSTRFLKTVGADKKLAEGRIQNMGSIQGHAVDKLPKPNKNDTIATWGFRGAVASKEVMAGVQFINVDFGDVINKDVGQQVVSTAGAADGAGHGALQGAASGGMAAPISVVVAELTRTITNRLTKRSVLKPGRAKGAFNLLEEGGRSRNESLKAFQSLIGKHDVISRAPRIGEKIIWYIDKLTQIETEFKKYYAPCARRAAGGSRERAFHSSAFATCDDAYKLVYNANYFFRNCEKLIAFLVYLEAILIQIDSVVSTMIHLPEGAIIKPGVKKWPKPVTVKDFKRPANA